MLFALGDWQKASEKADQPQKPEPTWTDVLGKVKANADYKNHQKRFTSSSLTPDDPAFNRSHEARAAVRFLQSWQDGRWDRVAEFASRILLKDKTDEAAIKQTRLDFEDHTITAFTITSIDFPRSSTMHVRGSAALTDTEQPIEIRMICWNDDGSVGIPGTDGIHWEASPWVPRMFFEVREA